MSNSKAKKFKNISPDDDVESSSKKKLCDNETHLTPKLCHMIIKGPRTQQLKAIELIIKMQSLNIYRNKDVLNVDGLLDKLVEFLGCEDDDQTLKLKTILVIVKLTSGFRWEKQAVIDAGALPLLSQLIDSENEILQDNAILAIGNIAGDTGYQRNLIIDSGVLGRLFNILLENKTSQKLIDRAIWCLSSLCQGMPIVRLKDMKKILPVLGQLLKTQTNPEALSDICWTISNMGSTNDRIREVIKSIDLKRLLELLENDKISKPVLRVFGNIASGNDKQTEVFIQLGLMEHLIKLIEHTEESFRIEVCWILSNITAGTRTQIQVVIDSGIIAKAMNLYHNSNLAMKKEIAWILGNLIKKGSRDQIAYIVENGAIEILLDYLENMNACKFQIHEWFQNLVNLIDTENQDIITKKCRLLKRKDFGSG